MFEAQTYYLLLLDFICIIWNQKFRIWFAFIKCWEIELKIYLIIWLLLYLFEG